MFFVRSQLAVVGSLLLSACSREPSVSTPAAALAQSAAQVDSARLAAAAAQPDQWFTPGRDGEGTYYSPLEDINDRNVDRLGFAWSYSLGTRRGQEATPVVVDGVMYAVGNWGRVYALDAASGTELWQYDPQTDGQWWGRYACCDVVNRGVAVWEGKVYVGSIDGYLHAIDARTGKRVWKIDTLTGRGPKAFHYFITGAPLIAGDQVVIGNGGSDFTGARGSVSAYDVQTGTFKWRFYTVPRDPRAGPQDQAHLESAARTWPVAYDWSAGGGGSAWDGMAYDPQRQLVYVGTANPIPYRVEMHAQGGSDELFADSIVALHAPDGQLAWHYQETPGDGWDYDATAKMILADIDVDGRSRAVLMQASKNGFLYVLDRQSGDVIAATAFTHVNWTRGIDPATHRPLPTPDAEWAGAPKLIFPSPMGGHSWQPTSYSPKTRLLYVPAIDAPMVYINTQQRRAGLLEGSFELAFVAPEDYDPRGLRSLFGNLPPLDQLVKAAGAVQPPRSRGVLRAIDPATGKVVWEQQGQSVWDGGVLSTAGNLVVRGDSAGRLSIYQADGGRLLKQIDVGTSIMAAPMTYRVKGVQFVSVMAGYGGGVLYAPFPAESAARKYGNANRIVTFRLDGTAVPKPAALTDVVFPEPPQPEGTAAQIASGEVLYNRYCARCHAFGPGLLPDLRRLSAPTHKLFYEIVLNGAYQAKGMARWDDVLSRADAEAIHAYLVDQAWQAFKSH